MVRSLVFPLPRDSEVVLRFSPPLFQQQSLADQDRSDPSTSSLGSEKTLTTPFEIRSAHALLDFVSSTCRDFYTRSATGAADDDAVILQPYEVLWSTNWPLVPINPRALSTPQPPGEQLRHSPVAGSRPTTSGGSRPASIVLHVRGLPDEQHSFLYGITCGGTNKRTIAPLLFDGAQQFLQLQNRVGQHGFGPRLALLQASMRDRQAGLRKKVYAALLVGMVPGLVALVLIAFLGLYAANVDPRWKDYWEQQRAVLEGRIDSQWAYFWLQDAQIQRGVQQTMRGMSEEGGGGLGTSVFS